jgi:hypothetical protein
VKSHLSGLVLALAVPTLFVGASFAAAAHATTGAGVVIDVPVTVSSSRLTVKQNEYSHKRLVRYPRGTTVHFHIKNMSRRTIRPQIRVESGLNFVGANKVSKITRAPKAVAPGHTGTLNVYFFFRGTFSFEAIAGEKAVSSAPVAVF